jgi:hypothetical protein
MTAVPWNMAVNYRSKKFYDIEPTGQSHEEIL